VKYELEQGIFDPDTSSTEVRMKNAEFARATGKLTVKYPLVVKTTIYKKATAPKDVKIDGSSVTYDSSAITLPEVAFGSQVKPLRAYDASGKDLERASGRTTMQFNGKVAEVRIDQVEKWGEVTVDYDLPPAPKWPASQQGLVPPMQERMKEVPGGRVVKQVKKQ
jgi:hypothetical protein